MEHRSIALLPNADPSTVVCYATACQPKGAANFAQASMRRIRWVERVTRATIVVLFLVVWATAASAQTDEIQVYDAKIADPGVLNLMVHNNFTPDGLKMPRFPGGLVPNGTLNGVPEWAYGVTNWFEQGLYLPLYSLSSNEGAVLDGFKVRELFVLPDAAKQTFFYGMNFEFSYNAKHWDENRYTSEIRPIIGWHLGKFDFIINPILDNSWKGFNQLDFAPCARIAYNISQTWAVAVEHYSDFGPIKQFLPANQQSQQLFGVVDYKSDEINVEAGVGLGLTGASDRLVIKLMLSRDLYKPQHKAD
jgi:hypothetical protein